MILFSSYFFREYGERDILAEVVRDSYKWIRIKLFREKASNIFKPVYYGM